MLTVTWEDQERINKFSRLHAALADVEEEMQVRRTEREELEDLGLEIELLDDDTVLYRIGEAYIHMAREEATAQMELDTERANADIARLKASVEDCEAQMKELKVALYAKFGSNINLER
ncbi:hypothetical protein MVES_003608 [Malassezia vespertilionis]|uniref:Prefoldin subunit 4 n=1 Tax=Malassezia vespertilionis TaxID=2020962 RepID=A0A2N1J778_9BASI|nr:hypothetical protein MVES_003608 [Malassezia vespertilionis]